MNTKLRILVLCTGNSCRSQMAEGYLRHFAQGRAEVFSAGLEAHGVNPYAIRVMQEDGIDISTHSSETTEAYRGCSFDHVITVCNHAHEHCPWFPAGLQIHHRDFPDPAKAIGGEVEILKAFRDVRDQINVYCAELISMLLDPQ
jgi:arsenate reductase